MSYIFRDIPRVKNEFVPLSTILLVFKVVHSPSTFSLGQVTQECLVIPSIRGLLNNNLLVVLAQGEDDVFGLLLELELLVLCNAIRMDTDTGGGLGE